MAKQKPDPVMVKVVALFEQSGKTLDELGLAMGYPADSARKSIWQLLRQTGDPRISMLRKFAKAMDVTLEELVSDKPKKRKGQSD